MDLNFNLIMSKFLRIKNKISQEKRRIKEISIANIGSLKESSYMKQIQLNILRKMVF